MHIYRLTVADSVEQRILDLQEAKRNLAKAAIEGGAKALNKLSMQDILMLFKSDAHDHTGEDRGRGEQYAAFLGPRQRVLDGLGGSGDGPRQWNQQTDRVVAKFMSRQPRVEDSVYGRR